MDEPMTSNGAITICDPFRPRRVGEVVAALRAGADMMEREANRIMRRAAALLHTPEELPSTTKGENHGT